MIYTGTSEVGGIYVGSTEIAEVYRGTDLVYQNISPEFTTFEANGSGGSVYGNLVMPRGKYRIIMCGGGGDPGMLFASGSDTNSVSCGGGAGIYGIMEIGVTTHIRYAVGRLTASTGISCDKTTGGSQENAWYVWCSGGGAGTTSSGFVSVSGIQVFSSYAINKSGNEGYSVTAKYALDMPGGASVLSWSEATSDYPAIDYSWGRGASAKNTTSGLAGFLHIEKIS